LDGTETLTNKTLTGPTISSPTLTGSISATDVTITGDTTIGDNPTDSLTVNATLASGLVFLDDTYDIGASGATRPRNLYLSGNATIGGTVTLSGGIDVTGALGVDGDFDVNTDKFTVTAADGNTSIAGTLGVTGAITATGTLKADTISEITATSGVTVDGVVLKDSQVSTDQINEKTADAGVTVDGVLLKDSQVNTDQINEKTADAGVTVDGVLLKDSQVNTDQINEKTADAGVTIDSVLLKDDVVNASDIETSKISANDGTTAINIANSTGAVDIDTSLNVDGTITGDGLTIDGLGVIDMGASAGIGLTVQSDNNAAVVGPHLKLYSGRANTASYNMLTIGNSSGTLMTVDGRGGMTLTPSASGAAIFNEGGADADFRVESATNTHALFVDAGNSRVGINKSSPGATLDVVGQTRITHDGTGLNVQGATQSLAGGNSQVKIGSTDTAAADKGGQLNFTANTTSFANYPVAGVHGYHETLGAGNYSGYLAFYTTATGGSITERVRINSGGLVGVNLTDPQSALHVNQNGGPQATGDMTTGLIVSNGTAGTAIQMGTNDASGFGYIKSAYVNSSQTARALLLYTGTTKAVSLETSETVINDDSLDRDFRVESDAYAHMLFVDAGNNSVNINHSTANSGFALFVQGTATSGARTANFQGPDVNTSTATSAPVVNFRNTNSTTGNFSAITFGTANDGTTAFIGAKNLDHSSYYGDLYIATRGAINSYSNKAVWHDTEFVSNEEGINYDFRVESDNNSNAFSIDAGSDRVEMRVETRVINTHVEIENTLDASGNDRVALLLDTPGSWSTAGNNNTSTTIQYQNGGTLNNNVMGRIKFAYDSTAGNTGWDFTDCYQGVSYGSSGSILSLKSNSGAVFNEDSNDRDFRVESDGNANMLFVDAGSNHVNVGTSTDRGSLLNVQGANSTNLDALTLYNTHGNAGTQGAVSINMSVVNSISNVPTTKLISQESTTDSNYAEFIIQTSNDNSSNLAEVARFSNSSGTRYFRLASGTGGIQFGGDTAAANALDDYEEGTFTPVVRGRSTAGTGTYTRQSGYYTKVGRTVTIHMDIGWSAHTGSGGMEITLPFATGSGYQAGGFMSYNAGMAYGASAGDIVSLWMDSTTTNLRFYYYNRAGGSAPINVPSSINEAHFQIIYNT